MLRRPLVTPGILLTWLGSDRSTSGRAGRRRHQEAARKPRAARARDWIRVLAASSFVGESLLFVLLYVTAFRGGGTIGFVPGPPLLWFPLFGLALLCVGLAVYLLADARRDLASVIARRWHPMGTANVGPGSAARGSRRGLGHAAVSGAASVVFFSEAMTLAVSLGVTVVSASAVAVSTNAYGEFWAEAVLVAAATLLAAYLLVTSASGLVRDVFRSLRASRSVPRGASRRWARSLPLGVSPLRSWSPPAQVRALAQIPGRRAR